MRSSLASKKIRERSKADRSSAKKEAPPLDRSRKPSAAPRIGDRSLADQRAWLDW